MAGSDAPRLPHGIITVLNTPFKPSGEIDLSALRRHVQYACRAGVAGLLVPAMASETDVLSDREKIDLVSTVMDAVPSEMTVIAGAGGSDPDRSRSLAKKYLKIGCGHILYQFPFNTIEEYRATVHKVADIDCNSIILQDWQPDGYGIPDELILELFENINAFKGIKIETVPAGLKYSRILSLTEGRLHVSGGWAVNQMIEGLQRGVHAFMPTALHYTYTRVYRYYKEGLTDEAEALFQRMLPILSFSNQHLDISIHFFKRLLYRQGIYPSAIVRKRTLPFDHIHASVSDRLIKKALQLESESEKYNLTYSDK